MKNIEKFELKTEHQGEDYLGWLSPISPINLPTKARALAGIPPYLPNNDFVKETIRGSISTLNATSYSFFHPPKGLAKALDWSKYRSEIKDLRESLSCEKFAMNYRPHMFAVLFGGYGIFVFLKQFVDHFLNDNLTIILLYSFVYFDDNFNIIQVNGEFFHD